MHFCTQVTLAEIRKLKKSATPTLSMSLMHKIGVTFGLGAIKGREQYKLRENNKTSIWELSMFHLLKVNHDQSQSRAMATRKFQKVRRTATTNDTFAYKGD